MNALGVVSKLPNKKRVIGCMHNVLYVPKLSNNLFRVRESASNGNYTFFGLKCWIRNKRRKLIDTGSPVGKLYRLDCEILKSDKQSAFMAERIKIVPALIKVLSAEIYFHKPISFLSFHTFFLYIGQY